MLNIKKNRRDFLFTVTALTGSLWISACKKKVLPTTKPSLPKSEKTAYFSLIQREGHWWFLTPERKPFFSIGLNHFDPASMRYPENIHLWKEKYKGSTINWIQESVSPNLKKWGFNTVGWVQEVTVRQWRHSRSFTHDEYKALNMPYCHLLPFTETHQWEQHTAHFDFFSKEWEEWCDYVARSHCAELSEDPNLIGYFYSDCPTWIHTRPHNEWRGPLFDSDRLKTESGRKALSELATQYYKTTYEAIRRYDKNHLILGDRYEANEPIAMEVINAALPYVDVLSFQDFGDPVTHLKDWYQKTGKPVLLADAAKMKWHTKKGEFTENNGQWYAEILAALHKNPGCVGFHLCGAYQRNKARRYGLLDEQERPDQKNVTLMKAANEKIQQWMNDHFE